VKARGVRVHHCSEHFLARFRLRDLATHLCPMSCDVNVCSICAAHRRRTTLAAADWKFDLHPPDDDRLRMFTLTYPRQDQDVRYAAELFASLWGRFVRSRAWKYHVHGAFAGFETTGRWPAWEEGMQPGASGWLWHVHVVASGKFWPSHCRDDTQTDRPWSDRDTLDPASCPCRERRRFIATKPGAPGSTLYPEGHGRLIRDARHRCIASLWHDVTEGRAQVVDARLVDGDNRKAEAIKYVCKTMELSDSALREYCGGMVRFQCSRWYGAWFGVKPPLSDKDLEAEVTASLADLWAVATGLLPSVAVRLGAAPVEMMIMFKRLEHTCKLRFEMIDKPRSRGPPEPHLIVGQDMALAVMQQIQRRISRMESLTKGFYEAAPWKRYGWIAPGARYHPGQTLPY
jgi:hypothetical protein